MITVYHNPRCKKSRAGLQYIRDKGMDVQVIEYINHPLSKKEIHKLLQQLNVEPIDIVRKQEDLYKKELKGKQFSNDEWLTILSENPRLIQRPIVLKDHKAVIADPPERVDSLF